MVVIPIATNSDPITVETRLVNPSEFSATRRNSWVKAIPALLKVRLVRSHARNVRSFARWSRATLAVFWSFT